MVVTTNSQPTYYVSVDAVKRAIELLASRRSHEHLPGYLALLRATHLDTRADVAAIESFHAEYLAVGDAPPDRPYLQPFRSRGRGVPTLLNPNVQGSYAPSSIREGRPFSRVLQTPFDGSSDASTIFRLVDDHADRVLSSMLAGNKIPAISLAAFLFRDRALALPSRDSEHLVDALRTFLGIEHEETTYATLFCDDTADYDGRNVLEEANVPGVGESVPQERTRSLSLDDLDLQSLITSSSGLHSTEDASILEPSDPILGAAREAVAMGYAGVILSGPPGTGKSWYAQQIAVDFSRSWEAVRCVQFHPSYQYEDFVLGYVPSKSGGFVLQRKELPMFCDAAAKQPERTHVMVIDEINRSDVVRVFGEALTYIETDKREQPFQTSSGEEMTIPKNVLFIGTMNPWDKGIDELDFALERRFAQIELRPDAGVLRRLLLEQHTPEALIDGLVSFFDGLQQQPTEATHLGHAYFLPCTSVERAQRTWEFRLAPTLRRACDDQALFEELHAAWNQTIAGM